jgi:hypothetical protein
LRVVYWQYAYTVPDESVAVVHCVNPLYCEQSTARGAPPMHTVIVLPSAPQSSAQVVGVGATHEPAPASSMEQESAALEQSKLKCWPPDVHHPSVVPVHAQPAALHEGAFKKQLVSVPMVVHVASLAPQSWP